MRANKEAELLIDLTEIHAQHDASVSKHAVFLSVIVSLMLAVVTVYIPLTLFFNNIHYSIYAIVFDVVLLAPLLWVAGRIRKAERTLEKRIMVLRNVAASVSPNKKRLSERAIGQPEQLSGSESPATDMPNADSPDSGAADPESADSDLPDPDSSDLDISDLDAESLPY